MPHHLDAASQVRSLSILLAEDEPGDRELFEIALARNASNCRLEMVEDGFEALRYLRCEAPYQGVSKPDLVILDLNLPGKDGREVLRDMKSDSQLNYIPVIVLSTSYDEGDVLGAYQLGACSYIVKPGNFHDFNTVVRRMQEYWFQAATLPRRH